jgi:nicotinamidase/pyrazinamidase
VFGEEKRSIRKGNLPVKPAIVIVDMLKDAFKGKDPSSIEEYVKIVPRIRDLLGKARMLSIPIIFACDSFLEKDFIFKGKRSYSVRGTEGAEVIDEFQPIRKDEILLKRRFSAFFKTDLDQTLRLLGVDTVVITGINTQVCVYATAMDSVCHDFYTIVLEDCTASRNREVHQGSIGILRQCGLSPLLRVMSSEEFMKEVVDGTSKL